MKVTITGIPPYDGEYLVEPARLTNRDLHTIKQITGYTPDRLDEAGADTDFVVALAIIGVRKSLRFQRIDEDKFWDAEIGKITLDFEDEEAADDGPPPNAPETRTMLSGAPSPTDGDKAEVRSLPLTGTDSSAS